MTNLITVDKYGNKTNIKKATLPNLDPNFLLSSGSGGTITTGEMAEKPYQNHVWTYASAKVISRNVCRLPKGVSKKSNPDKIEFEHPVLDIFDNPNPWMTSIGFWESICLALSLPSTQARTESNDSEIPNRDDGGDTGGQVFLVCYTASGEKCNLTRGDIPDMILPFTDKYIRAKETYSKKDGVVLEGWELVNGANNTTIDLFEPNEIIRINQFNPYDWLRGLSPFSAASMAFVDDVKSDIYNTQSFENDGTVAGLLTTEADLTPDQFEINLKRWNRRNGGVGNNNKIALIANGLKYDQFGLSQADMQFTNQKEFIFQKFAAAYGLNKIAYGMYENINFATIKEGRKMLWQDTYMPLDQLITNTITNQWVKWVENGLMLKSDYSKIDALRPDYSKPAAAAKTMVEMGYPASLASRINNIPLTDEMIAKYPWLDEKPIQRTNQPPQEEPKKTIQKTISKKGLTEEERIALSWDYIHKVLDPGEKKWKSTMDRFFTSQRNRMQDKVDIWLKKQKAIPQDIKKDIYLKTFWNQVKKDYGKIGCYQLKNTVNGYLSAPFYDKEEGLRMLNNPNYHDWDDIKALSFKKKDIKTVREFIIDPVAFLLNPLEENIRLMEQVKPLIVAQMKREKMRLQEELGSLIEWNVTDDNIQEFIDDRKNEIKEINTTTFKKANKKIGKAIEVSMLNNETPQEAAKRIKAAISDTIQVRKNQAATIARTETGIISSTSRFKAFHVEGIEYHEWLNAADEKVRLSHMQKPVGAGGEVVRVGSIFPAVYMRFPLDPDGMVDQIVNCRCVAIPAEAPKK